MKRIAIPIETDELCSYGCGNIAKFKNKSGTIMCNTSAQGCPIVKKKNSDGLKKAYKEGRKIVIILMVREIGQKIKLRLMITEYILHT